MQCCALLRVIGIALLPLLLGACGPVPGGRLEGTLTPTPPAWSSVLEGERGICEVESRPADPHSIQLDCFLHDGHLYVQSHRWAFASWWPVESWAQVWRAHSAVRVRIDSSLFELRAVHVTEPAERSSVLESRGYEPIPEGIAVFRFDRRE